MNGYLRLSVVVTFISSGFRALAWAIDESTPAAWSVFSIIGAICYFGLALIFAFKKEAD